jgi:hypothetical protein
MLALLFYGYAQGIFSSRKIERATDELIPVLYITGGTHPDHDSINTFRQRFLPQLEGLFLQILVMAEALGVLKLGDVSLDGAKILANASQHHAMSGGEPVFGIIKEVMGFRRFLLRGLEKVKGEWRWVCLAYNLKRLCVLNQGVTAS